MTIQKYNEIQDEIVKCEDKITSMNIRISELKFQKSLLESKMKKLQIEIHVEDVVKKLKGQVKIFPIKEDKYGKR